MRLQTLKPVDRFGKRDERESGADNAHRWTLIRMGNLSVIPDVDQVCLLASISPIRVFGVSANTDLSNISANSFQCDDLRDFDIANRIRIAKKLPHPFDYNSFFTGIGWSSARPHLSDRRRLASIKHHHCYANCNTTNPHICPRLQLPRSFNESFKLRKQPQ